MPPYCHSPAVWPYTGDFIWSHLGFHLDAGLMLHTLTPEVWRAEFSLGHRLHIELMLTPKCKARGTGAGEVWRLPGGGGKHAQLLRKQVCASRQSLSSWSLQLQNEWVGFFQKPRTTSLHGKRTTQQSLCLPHPLRPP